MIHRLSSQPRPTLGALYRHRPEKLPMPPLLNQRFMSDGAELHYDVAGAGAPLVLVHAGIADRTMWEAQFLPLAEHFRVIRLDLRGFGQSLPVAGDFAHRHDLARLLDHLGLQRAHLIGCSQGGGVCLDFALEFPQRVTGLVLVCSALGGNPDPGQPAPQAAAIEAAYAAGDLALTSELEVQVWVDGPQRTPDQLPAALRDHVRAMNLTALRHEATGLGNPLPLTPPAFGRLGAVQAPTLVLIGALDVARTVAAGHYLAAHIPGARALVFPDCAHLPNLEQPDLFNAVVLDFLRGL
jgi:pimeloyl-ACP methyl ester carboxylesterase